MEGRSSAHRGDVLKCSFFTACPGPAANNVKLYPNQVLDCNIDLYVSTTLFLILLYALCTDPKPASSDSSQNYDNINKVFSPHQDELINLYYEYLHPSYPILERREIFRAQKNRNEIPCSLLAVVLSHGFEFWSRSRTLKHLNAPNARKLRPYIHAMLTVEIRTPNLGVLQAILLYLQLAPIIVRESNHPGHWGLTCLAVAVAQDIGLHIEPGQWNISIEERKLRRILWWAVYVHDKWIAQWLGRPSHIIRTNWSVLPLTLRDFSNADDMLSVDEVTQGKVFIALCELTEVLDDVLEGFYSVRTNFESMEPDTSRSLGDTILQRLQRWRSSNGQLQSTKDSAHLTVSLCGLTVETLVRKALAVALQTSHGTQHNDEKMATMMSDVSEVIGSIVAADRRQSQQWLSYIRGSLMTIGSQLITMVLSSVDDVKLEQHRERLMTFRGQLVELAQHDETEFARLPLRRLDMIISELLGEDDEIMEDIEPILALDLSGTKSTSDICTAAFNVAMAHMTP